VEDRRWKINEGKDGRIEERKVGEIERWKGRWKDERMEGLKD
jgi:hypothetical protein